MSPLAHVLVYLLQKSYLLMIKRTIKKTDAKKNKASVFISNNVKDL